MRKRSITLHKEAGILRLDFLYIITCILAWGGLFDLVCAQPANAYIDPNTGGFFFQTVAPFIYGILGVIVVFWKRIAGFVKGTINRSKNKAMNDQDN